MNRRTSALCCLLMTAALLSALPSLWTMLSARDGERMAERLRPQKTQILTVWVLSDQTEGKKLLSEQIALFEKENPVVRVYLRWADAAELFAEDAVLPDALLFSPGALTEPWRVLAPIASLSGVEGLGADAQAAGRSRNVQYAVPLWFSPAVLAVPTAFFPKASIPTPKPTQTSFFDLSTPAPSENPSGEKTEDNQLPDASLIPWQALLEPDAMRLPKGLALIQLLSMCPVPMRPALTSIQADPQATPAPAKAAQTPAANVMSLAAYLEALGKGEALAGFPLTPACTENVLFMGLCNDQPLTRTFAAHFLAQEAQAAAFAHGLLPAVDAGLPPETMTRQLAASYQNGLLFPNAFEHTAQELQALCQDTFRRNQNPVEALLRLR